MNISEKKFNNIFNGFIIFIALSMALRKPCTWLIIIFTVFNLLNYKRFKFDKITFKAFLIIASPFLIEVLFFWNNESFVSGVKSLEKSLTLIIFPLFILGNYKQIQLDKILKYYSIGTTYVMLILLARFILFFPEYANKYLNGIDLWQSGYEFARSFGNHAPAVNMHMAFVCVINLYFLLNIFEQRQLWFTKIGWGLTFLLSFFLILVINTKMALFDVLVCFGILFFYEVVPRYGKAKVIKIFGVISVALSVVFVLYVRKNPYMKEKYFTVAFKHMDKVGRLDEVENPEAEVYNSFVTRVSIWKSVWELSTKNLPFGVGAADAKPELFKYYKDTNQKFLFKNEFPTHNQYLDYLLRFGVLGVLTVFLYILNIAYLGYKTQNALIMSFFFIFFTSNTTDDYLILFQGIAFSGLWISLFQTHLLQKQNESSSLKISN